MTQITGTSSTPFRAVDGQPNISLPSGVAIAAGGGGLAAGGIGQPFAVPGDCAGRDITWDLIITGTAPTTLEVDLEGSLDQGFTVATANSGSATGAQLDTYTGTVSTQRSVTAKQVSFVRLNVITLTGGDATTRIVGRIYLAKRGAGL